MRTIQGDRKTLEALAEKVSADAGYPRTGTNIGAGPHGPPHVTERATEPTVITPPGWKPGDVIAETVLELHVLEADAVRAKGATIAVLDAAAKSDVDAPKAEPLDDGKSAMLGDGKGVVVDAAKEDP